MTGIELYAFVILPISITAGVWAAILISERIARRRGQ
jgi:hypothetical protein